MSDQKKSMIVVGGGPGGYTAAFAAAKAGMAVTLVECAELGGTCLNNGCIPTKTIKSSAEALELARKIMAVCPATVRPCSSASRLKAA